MSRTRSIRAVTLLVVTPAIIAPAAVFASNASDVAQKWREKASTQQPYSGGHSSYTAPRPQYNPAPTYNSGSSWNSGGQRREPRYGGEQHYSYGGGASLPTPSHGIPTFNNQWHHEPENTQWHQAPVVNTYCPPPILNQIRLPAPVGGYHYNSRPYHDDDDGALINIRIGGGHGSPWTERPAYIPFPYIPPVYCPPQPQ